MTGKGQTALVTGASAGIGVDLAECFAKDGYDLILCARTESALRDVADRLAGAYGVKVTPIVSDLGAIDGGAKLAAEIKALGLDVDVLVNNAGYGHAGAFTSSDRATQLGMIDLNDRALVELTHIYWDGMLARSRGGVLNVASTAAFQPMPYQAGYAATKAFVLSFSEALAEELRGSGIRVMAAHPGPVGTGFFDGTTAKMDPRTTDTPEAVAAGTLDDFASGKHASYPGRASNRRKTWGARFLPRRRVAAITGRITRKAGFDRVSDVVAPKPEVTA